MKKIWMTILVLVAGANYYFLAAQQPGSSLSDSLNPAMQKIAKPESIRGWLKFKEDANINPSTLFIEHKTAFDLSDNDKMVLLQTNIDDLGFKHYQYQQYYKTLRIDGATFTIHSNKNGIPYAGNGKLVTGTDLDVVPQLGMEKAIQLALQSLPANEYMWQSEFWENDLKSRTHESDTSYYPKPELVIKPIISRNMGAYEVHSFLAYRLDIYSASPNFSTRIYVDANDGKILEAFSLQSK